MDHLKFVLVLLFAAIQVGYAQNTADEATKEKDYKIRAIGELGFLGVFDHKIQFGQENTTYFDYVRDGGQDNLFFNARLAIEFEFKERNIFTFLYQPLNLETRVELNEDIRIDDTFFPAGSNVNLKYGFPFYRLSYLRYFVKTDKLTVGGGLSLQIRNADIRFESGDGSQLVASRDVGFVPALKFRMGYHYNDKMSTEIEADGMYAPISILNGSDTDVLGSILDISIRQNFQIMDQLRAYATFRYIGGGAQGQGDDFREISDGYSKNWLHLFAISLGFSYEF